MCKVGVGVVAARVTVCKADHILFHGCDGDAGASKCAGLKHAGAGLAGMHQAFVLNGYKVVPTTSSPFDGIWCCALRFTLPLAGHGFHSQGEQSYICYICFDVQMKRESMKLV